MAKPTLASLSDRLDRLEAAAAADRATYERDFFRAKRAEKQGVALRAPRPAGESPTFKQLLLDAAARHALPIHELTIRGGVVSHKGQALA